MWRWLPMEHEHQRHIRGSDDARNTSLRTQIVVVGCCARSDAHRYAASARTADSQDDAAAA